MAERILLFISLCLALGQTQSIGDRLVRTAIIYKSLPLTVDDAVDAGWVNFTHCDNNLGYAYTDTGSLPSKTHPVILYFTGGGQIAGMGMEHFGEPVNDMEQYFRPTDRGTYRITVSFRPGGNLCSSRVYREAIGTQLNVDQGIVDFILPLNESAATDAQWTKGGCIGGMGTHWSYDLSSAPTMTWKSGNLFPVITMYNEQAGGGISAFFITTPNLQYAEPLGPWEGPIPSNLMCYNWCSDDCDWDVLFWNTLHFYLDDHSLNTCPTHCN